LWPKKDVLLLEHCWEGATGPAGLVLLRYGLVATVAGIVFVNEFVNITIGADWRAWYVPSGLATLLLLLGIALFAFCARWETATCWAAAPRPDDRN
jgi:hypothetical protein